MQCVSCGFENLPGQPTCVRCRSVLDVQDVAVVPGRASALRLTNRLLRLWYPFERRVPTFVELWCWLRTRLRIRVLEPVHVPAVLRSVVPGWGHWWLGRRHTARLLLTAWLACLVLAAWMIATDVCPWLIYAAVLVHAVTVVSLFASNLCWERLPWRALFGATTFVALYCALYLPVLWLGGRFVRPVPLHGIQAGGPVEEGDGILVLGPWFKPESFAGGELVFYTLPAIGTGAYQVQAGYGLDRILAVPGQHVRVDGTQIEIDGQPLPAGAVPLTNVELPAYQRRLGRDEYFVVPSQLILRWDQPTRGLTALLDGLLVVRHEQIIGRAAWRVHPLKRFGRLE